jgi:chromosome segregation protein
MLSKPCCASDQRALEAERAHEQVQATDAEIQSLQERTAVVRRELNDAQQKAHEHQVEALKLTQARSRYEERVAQIERDLGEITDSSRQETAHLERAEAELARSRELAEAQRQRLEQALGVQREADDRLREARALESQLAREAQEAGFSERECATKLDDLARTIQLAASQLERVAREREQDELERATLDEGSIEMQLQSALELRTTREVLLTARRDALEAASAALRELEELRGRSEEMLEPLRNGLSDLRLKEQAAQLNEEQYSARLLEAQVDEAAVAAKLESDYRDVKELTLTRDINRLNREVNELARSTSQRSTS